MTEAMPFLQNYDITFLRPPPINPRGFFLKFYRIGSIYSFSRFIL